MIFDWHHLKDRQTNYWSHLFFAMAIALRIIVSGVALVAHALIPFIHQPRYVRIGELSNYLFDMDYHTKKSMLEPGKHRR